jgi:hypothetical protein
MYMGINSALQPCLPQNSSQILDETPKARIIFFILRNTRLRIFDFSSVNDQAPLLGFEKQGSPFFRQQSDSTLNRWQMKFDWYLELMNFTTQLAPRD